MSAVSAYFAGDYVACCSVAATESSTGVVRSVWFRACVQCGRHSEARSLAKGNGALDAALLLYLDAFPLRHDKQANWTDITSRAEKVGSLEGDRDEVAVILSIIHSWADQLEDAYRLASQSSSLEAQLLTVAYLAMINRFDLAERRLEKLKNAHVDNLAFQLVEAEVALRRDALYIYQELVQMYGRTPKLLNGQAAACLLADRLSDAEALILENPHDSMALSHLINLSIARGSGVHLVNDQLARLAAADKKAPFLKLLEEYAVDFERTAAKLAMRPYLYLPSCSAPAVLSNSAGGPDDTDHLHARQLEESLGLPIIRHRWKKPMCSAEIAKTLGTNALQTVMVGDRLATDVWMANEAGMLSIHTKMLSSKDDNPNAVKLRQLENWILERLGRSYTRPDLQSRFIKTKI
ncbi:HAD phosphatase, family IIIA [Paramicrosporidium saccamoebae]|uniref:HAD phosphatase, family IIIA n=1 Tax=Paramicrosporidium saccamoebae TaxID=1246581 RepID=A0A2H9TK48_9FUNG|nr:HAD phosphatase, family IIIA [Paramicrosporidium saccamoebae]